MSEVDNNIFYRVKIVPEGWRSEDAASELVKQGISS
jgi:hypothetical protein